MYLLASNNKAQSNLQLVTVYHVLTYLLLTFYVQLGVDNGTVAPIIMKAIRYPQLTGSIGPI